MLEPTWTALKHHRRIHQIVATLVRAIVVGPIARLELLPLDAVSTGSSEIIEAQIAAQQFATLMLKEGETLVLTPRRARVFVA